MIKGLRRKFILVAMSSTLAVLVAIMGVLNVVNYVRMSERADNLTQLVGQSNGSLLPPDMQPEKESASGDADQAANGSGQQPGEDGQQPGDDGQQPGEDGQRPGEDGQQPGEDGQQPGDDGQQPKDDGQRPKEDGKQSAGGDRMDSRDHFSPETPYDTRYFSVTFDADGTIQSTDTQQIAALNESQAQERAKEAYAAGRDTGFLDVYRYRKMETDDGVKLVFVDCRKELELFRSMLLTTTTVSLLGFALVFGLVLLFSKMVFRPVAQAYDKQKQFITDASHEIKTPLTIIDANAQVLEMEGGTNQWITSIQNQVKRLSALTQQLVSLARLEERQYGERIRFSLSDAVCDSVRPYEALAITRSQRLTCNIEEGVELVGEEPSIRQLIGILLDNAIKYTPSQGTIQVELCRKGKKVQLQVRNEAEGVPVGKLDRLMERFYRLDDSHNSQTGGSGIGLSVAQAIVAAHKGRIHIFSEDGKSLTVTVLF